MDEVGYGDFSRSDIGKDQAGKRRTRLVGAGVKPLGRVLVQSMDAKPDNLARLLSGNVGGVPRTGFAHRQSLFLTLRTRADDPVEQSDLLQLSLTPHLGFNFNRLIRRDTVRAKTYVNTDGR